MIFFFWILIICTNQKISNRYTIDDAWRFAYITVLICLHKSDYDMPGFYETIFPKINTIEFVQKHLVSFHNFPHNFNSQKTKYLIDLMLCFYTSIEDFPDFLFTFFGKSLPIISEKLKSSQFYDKQLLSYLVFYSTKDSANTDPVIPSNLKRSYIMIPLKSTSLSLSCGWITK